MNGLAREAKEADLLALGGAAPKPERRKVSDKVNRTIRSLEVTREGGPSDNGWHPHLHVPG